MTFLRFTAAIITAALSICHAAAAMSLSRSVTPLADGSAAYPPLPPPVSGWAPTLANATTIVVDAAVSPGAVTVRAAIPAPDRCGLPATFAVSVKAPPLQAPLLLLPPQPLGTAATIAPLGIEHALAMRGFRNQPRCGTGGYHQPSGLRRTRLQLIVDITLAAAAPGRPPLHRRFTVPLSMIVVGRNTTARALFLPFFPDSKAHRFVAVAYRYIAVAAAALVLSAAVFAIFCHRRDGEGATLKNDGFVV